jgi:hypothetical protein
MRKRKLDDVSKKEKHWAEENDQAPILVIRFHQMRYELDPQTEDQKRQTNDCGAPDCP